MAIKYQKKEDYRKLFFTLQERGLGSLSDKEMKEAYKGLARATRQKYQQMRKQEGKLDIKLRATADLEQRFTVGTDKYGRDKIIIKTPRFNVDEYGVGDITGIERSEMRKSLKSMLYYLRATDIDVEPFDKETIVEKIARAELEKFKDRTGMKIADYKTMNEFWNIYHTNDTTRGRNPGSPEYIEMLATMYEKIGDRATIDGVEYDNLTAEDVRMWWNNKNLSAASGIPVA